MRSAYDQEPTRWLLSHRQKVGLRIGAAALIFGSFVGIGVAEKSNSSTPVRPMEVSSATGVAQGEVSQDIGSLSPVTFRAAVLHYLGKADYYLDNPLEARTPDGTTLYGYIEPKGGSTGPAVVLFPFDSTTMSLLKNPTDQGLPTVNQVIFPSENTTAGFEVTDPIDPTSGNAYLDPAGNPLVVGFQFVPQKGSSSSVNPPLTA